jgi:Uma2 family endonuclease
MTTAHWPTTEPVGTLLTAEEYESLPDNPRRELVDGVIHLMPPASPRHQWIKDELCAALRQLQPGHLVTHTGGHVRLGPLHYRIPDIVVVTADVFARNSDGYLPPEEVLLAVEVVSPGTEQQDRETKPNEYAKAGIANFWRVETAPAVTIVTHVLTKAGIYVVAGSHSSGIVHPPTLPWATVDVPRLIT